MTIDKIIDLNDHKIVTENYCFCTNCGKAILVVAPKRHDLSREGKKPMTCPVCKNDMKLFLEVEFGDILHFISKMMRQNHKDKYKYEFEYTDDKKMEMFIMDKNLIEYVKENVKK